MERWESLKNGAIIHNPGTDGTLTNRLLVTTTHAHSFLASICPACPSNNTHHEFKSEPDVDVT